MSISFPGFFFPFGIHVLESGITAKAVVQIPMKFCPMYFFQACAKTKVGKFYMAFAVQEKVAWFEVSVDEFKLVNGVYG